MAFKTKIDPINLSLTKVYDSLLSPVESTRLFAEYAGEVIEEAKQQNQSVLGSVPKHTISVDGREGAPLTSVKVGGVVFVEFELVFEVIEKIRELLIKNSPVGKGSKPEKDRYRSSHALLADGVAVDDGAPPPIAERYVFVSTVPYARKIERGLSPQAPDGVYQAVSQLASKQYGNIARIKFGYETPLFGAIESWARTPQAKRWAALKSRRRQSLHAEWLRRQPAIIITLPG